MQGTRKNHRGEIWRLHYYQRLRIGQFHDVTEWYFTEKLILSVVYTIHKHSVWKLNIWALGFIKRNVKIRSPRIKEKLYNSLVRPHIEYASAVWSPHEVKPIHQLEMVQRRAARWTLNRHHNTSSVKGMLEDLQWRTLEQRRTECSLVLLFQIIHGLVQIPPTNYLQPSLNTTSRKNHNYTYQQCSTRTNYFKYSFFPCTTVIWNNLPYQLVNSPSVISFKAQVSKLQHIRE